MVTQVNEEKLKKGILEFEKTFSTIYEKKSFANISVPYPPIKELGWTKNTKLKITIIESN
jgi:hypothetical protein